MTPRLRWPLLVLLLIGFALRVWRLGAESLWYDETVSVALAQLPVADLIARTAGDIHPPGYYLLLHLWQAIVQPTPAAVGTGATQPLEFLYAFVSLAAAMVALALLVPLGKRLVERSAMLVGVALAAVNPFHIWYAQEVRMYSVAAALGLLTLWATLQWMERGKPRDLVVYALAAAAGLWSLYYCVFLLAGVGVAALLMAPTRKRLWFWVAAQAGVMLLYAPWLPVLWRQATDPPVPPWRAPWSDAASLAASTVEALAAPLLGQVALGPMALWALLVVALTAIFLARGATAVRTRWALVAAIFAPTLLLFAVSLLGPPLYHARYLFPWSAAFPLVAGGALVALGGETEGISLRRAAAWAVGGAIVVASLAALRLFWSAPAYRADDHRGAVASLAATWRPGDAILVNAGWVWTPLAVYWPQGDEGGPPSLAPMLRLNDVATGATLPDPATLAVPVIRTGSIDGSPRLGWGNPASDFFATTTAESTAGLNRLAWTYDRLWHYRLYDTVSDPAGDLRAWLDAESTLRRDDAIPGRDFGRLQLFETGRVKESEEAADGTAWLGAAGGAEVLRLIDARLSGSVEPGATLYATILLEPLPALGDLGVGISSSLRLYDANGNQIAQADESPLPPSTEWVAGDAATLRLAVTAPNPLPPGPVSVDLILYRQDDAAPLPLVGPRSVDGTRLRLR